MELFTPGNLITLLVSVIGFAFGYGMLSQRVKSLEAQLIIIGQVNDKLTAIQTQIAASSGQERPVAACRDHFDHQVNEFKKTISDAIELQFRRGFAKNEFK